MVDEIQLEDKILKKISHNEGKNFETFQETLEAGFELRFLLQIFCRKMLSKKKISLKL